MAHSLSNAPPNVSGSLEDWLKGEIARYADWFRERPLMVDAGAFHGDFARPFLAMPGSPFREAVLFEPNPDSFKVLQQKVAGDRKFRLVPKACSDQPGHAQLYCQGELYTGSLLPYDGERPGPRNEYQVDITTLDDFLFAENLASRIGLIKIDTQGNDLRVLKGGVRTLRAGRPWLVVEMNTTPRFVNQGKAVDTMRFLEEENYFLAAQFNDFYTSTGWLAWYDACFVPRELFSMDPLTNFPRK